LALKIATMMTDHVSKKNLWTLSKTNTMLFPQKIPSTLNINKLELPSDVVQRIQNGPRPRIVGGTQTTDRTDYPWFCSLISASGTSPYCGGSYIGGPYVVTAAHCAYFSGASQVRVVMGHITTTEIGDGTGTIYNVERIIMSHNYNDSTIDSDIAILELTRSPSSDGFSPISVATSGFGAGEGAGTPVTVLGFGATSETGSQSSTLQELQIPIVADSVASSIYGSNLTNNMITAGVLAAGSDSCFGDSGGPLSVQVSGTWTLVGIVSWGIGCAREGFPGVYTRVQNFADDIQSIQSNKSTTWPGWVNVNSTPSSASLIASSQFGQQISPFTYMHGEENWFVFNTAAGTVSIETFPGPGDGDTILDVYTSLNNANTDNSSETNDDKSGSSLYSRVSFTASAGATYVRVRGYAGSAATLYGITVSGVTTSSNTTFTETLNVLADVAIKMGVEPRIELDAGTTGHGNLVGGAEWDPSIDDFVFTSTQGVSRINMNNRKISMYTGNNTTGTVGALAAMTERLRILPWRTIVSTMEFRVSHQNGRFTVDVARPGTDVVNLVSGARYGSSGNHKYTGTRGASKIGLGEGAITMSLGQTSGTRNGVVPFEDIVSITTGNFNITGTLNVTGSKNFRIPHPDPAKPELMLTHAALEGPESGVYYRGEACMNRGRSVVVLPDYAGHLALPDEWTVTVTPIFDEEGDDVSVPSMAVTRLKNGKFTVYAGHKWTGLFNWIAIGVRKDIPRLSVENNKMSFDTNK
jgi:hypothetical protein